MTDVGTWVAKTEDILVDGDNILSFIAGETIYAGQVVGFAATGVDHTVMAMDSTALEHAVGIALYNATVGQYVAVASLGCICNVTNADDTTEIDAGDWVQQDDAACKGAVKAFTARAALTATTIDATNDTTADGSGYLVGLAIDDIAGNSYGRVLIMPYLVLYSDHTVVA